MSFAVDPELLVDAILLNVQDLGDPAGKDWLLAEWQRVFAATMAGDEFVTSTSFKGQSGSSTREVSAQALLAVLTTARKRLIDEEQGLASTGAMLIPRLADFPLS